MFVPHEVIIGDLFIPPLLVASILGLIATAITTRLLNKFQLSKYFFYPPLAMIGLLVIYTVFIGWLIIPF